MRAPELLRLTGRSLRSPWLRLAAAFTALAAICLYFSGAALWTVWREKREPCELSVVSAAGTALSAADTAAMREIEDVQAAAGVIELSAEVSAGKYEAALTLTGIDPDYIQGTYAEGGVFPDGASMPWLVLNAAAQKLFADPDDNTRRDSGYMPAIDWLDGEFLLHIGENTRTAKVSGILDDGSDEAHAYMSLDMAELLRREQGEDWAYTRILLRVTDIGAAEQVEKALAGLGYTAENQNPQQQEAWKTETREAAYLALLGAALVVCALFAARIFLRGDRRALFAEMERLGITARTLRNTLRLKAALAFAAGAALGAFICCMTPIFTQT